MIIEYENEGDMVIAIELQQYIHKKGIKEFTVRASKEYIQSLKKG